MGNIRIGIRLIASFVIVSVLTAVVGIIGYSGINGTNESLQEVSKGFLPRVASLSQMLYNVRNVTFAQRTLLIQGLSPAQRQEQYANVEQARASYREGMKQYEALPRSAEEETVWQEFRTLVSQATDSNNKSFELIKAWERDQEDRDKYEDAVRYVVHEAAGINGRLPHLINSLIQINTARAKTAEENADRRVSTDIAVMVGTTTLAPVLALLLGILLTRSLTVPIGRGVDFAKAVSDGDFDATLDLHQKDELGVLASYLNTAFRKVSDKVYWYESVLDSIQFPLSVTDMDMKWTFVNKAALEATGLGREEVLGQPCSNWGAGICKTERCGIECLRRGETESGFHQAETNRNFQVNSSYLLDRSGEKVGHIEVVQDVTEAQELRQAAENALKDGILQAAAALEGVVAVITSASEELAAQIEESSRGSEAQSLRVAETALAMEEMNATVAEVTQSAAKAADTADRAKRKALDGAEAVKEVVDGIHEVQAQALGLKADMTTLGVQAEGIGRVLHVISDIADQTNLLALNAAIEAARAGEAGRGFAVVADEVRKLAEKTMTATKEVGDAIRAMQEGTKKNVGNVDQAVARIDAATALAGRSGDALREIVAFVDRTTDQVRSIAAASEEQSIASGEITLSIEDVNRISAETATTLQQSAQAVAELAHQAHVLKGLIDQMQAESGNPARQEALALPAGRAPARPAREEAAYRLGR